MTSGNTTLPPQLAVTEDPPPPTKRPSPVSPEARPGGRTRWRCGITPAGALLMAVVALGLALTSQRPLWHSDLWGHLAYGREIVESGEIPETAPLMPLARGVEFIDSAWLTQVVGYLAIREAGTTAIQLLGGLCVCLTGGVLLAMGWRNTRNLPWTLLGGASWLWLEWMQLFAGQETSLLIRPQLVGLLCFTITLAMLVGARRSWHWFAIPMVFAVWANTHGSFPVGLALIGIHAVGRATDILRRTDQFGAIFLDWVFWRYVLLAELAAVAVLLNPYGLRLYAEVLLFSDNPNLAALVEWEPLTLHMIQGQAAAGVSLILMFLFRMTPRRIRTAEVLALLVFGGLTLWTSRFLVWWAPIAAWSVMLHGSAIWRSRVRRRKSDLSVVVEQSQTSFWRRRHPAWILVGLATLGIGFVATPFGSERLLGRAIAFEDTVSNRTPLGAARHLSENPPEGLVFNSMEFGDFLIWTDPNIPVFAASHVHLIPRDVWQTYLEVIRGQAGWDSLLERQGVQVIVLDRARRQSFIDRLNENEGWDMTYQDFNSAVFRRVSEQSVPAEAAE